MASTAEEKENVPLDPQDEQQIKVTDNVENGKMRRLKYLLKQAEIFSHFVTSDHSKASKGDMRGKRKAMTAITNAPTNAKKRKMENGQASSTEEKEEVKEEKLMQYDKTPDFIVGEMHDYQIRGLNWLISLCEIGIGGLLGDEMGLGKTIQTISILGHLKNVGKIRGPFLVVAPLSTLPNWLKEANRFCPSLDAFILYGTKDVRSQLVDRLKTRNPRWDLCITNYETCRTVGGQLKRINWNFVVLDEGHKIKNETSQINRIISSFNTKHRLILTGTPLNNNLHELWALLSYLVPDVFSDADDFDSWFDSDDCLRGNDEIVKRLHAVLQPFMMRRVKSEVLTSLLPKKEFKLYIPMTPFQRDVYKKVLSNKVEFINGLGELSAQRLKMIVVELRKAANHPYLIPLIEPGPPYTTDQHIVDNCGKMIVLDQLLAKLKSQGSRVVLFSQFVIMLNIIDDYLAWKGYKYFRLDGNTPIAQRLSDIDSFNAEGSDAFIYIISTRAGGLGINLASADTVIVYDSDWNPQSDFQAIDRVHRIGQKKQVNIFRLVTENTIDNRIIDRAKIKQRLDKMVIHHGAKPPKEDPRNIRIADIKFAMQQAMLDDPNKADFDLEKILRESAVKEAEAEKRLEKMTFGEASSTSVYHFEGADYRAGRAATAN